jgi:MoaA/NifB/PqqE/SkfB family radical SAM enzyme
MTTAEARPSRPGWWNTLYHDGPMFTWDVITACNYRCLYCWHDSYWTDFENKYPVLPATDWLGAWRNVHDRYGTARIDVVGGEPFVYPGFADFVADLCGMHQVLVTTNLSLPLEALDRLTKNVSPDRFHINASFHPTFAKFGDFLDKLKLLRDRGFAPSALYVLSPINLEDCLNYRSRFQSENVPFVPLVYQGVANGRRYPDAYSAEEKRFIASILFEPHREGRIDYELNVLSTKGKPCCTGTLYAAVNATGDVYRCAMEHKGARPMGNIFDPEFRLKPDITACPFDKCASQDFRFLEEQMEKLGGFPNRLLAGRAA